MMTAEEFLQQYFTEYDIPWSPEAEKFYGGIVQAMIGFAQLHVEGALKEALESIPCLGSSSDIASYEEVEEAVLKAYPKEKII